MSTLTNKIAVRFIGEQHLDRQSLEDMIGAFQRDERDDFPLNLLVRAVRRMRPETLGVICVTGKSDAAGVKGTSLSLLLNRSVDTRQNGRQVLRRIAVASLLAEMLDIIKREESEAETETDLQMHYLYEGWPLDANEQLLCAMHGYYWPEDGCIECAAEAQEEHKFELERIWDTGHTVRCFKHGLEYWSEDACPKCKETAEAFDALMDELQDKAEEEAGGYALEAKSYRTNPDHYDEEDAEDD